MMELFERPLDLGVGYWGNRTAAVDWCEPNYTWSFYIAEFFNTVSSLPAAFFALYGLFLTFKYGYGDRFVVMNLMLGLVGVGSAAFHGTLLYTGQILDELPMVYAVLSCLYVILEMESGTKPIRPYLAPLLTSYAAIFTLVYLYLPSFFIFFVLSFIGAILFLSYQASLIYRKPTTLARQKIFILVALGSYIGGWLFFWIPEVVFCDRIQALNFHSWWHVTSTFGAFSLLLFSVFQRELHRGRKPELNYNCFAGVPILPYVHIPMEVISSKDSSSELMNVKLNSEEKESRKAMKKKISNSTVSSRR